MPDGVIAIVEAMANNVHNQSLMENGHVFEQEPGRLVDDNLPEVVPEENDDNNAGDDAAPGV